jgi:hypothetical protein
MQVAVQQKQVRRQRTQNQRLLSLLKRGLVTSRKAREQLEIKSPRARIMELRETGLVIRNVKNKSNIPAWKLVR